MKIQIMSDLHLDIWRSANLIPAVDRDLLILAGDVMEMVEVPKYAEFFRKQLEASPILWVMGNHEYYLSSIEKVKQEFGYLEQEFPGLTILDDEVYFVRDDLMIIGSTYWTDMNNNSYGTKCTAMKYLNDFRVITYRGSALHPEDTVKFNTDAVKFIDKTVRDSTFDGMQKIVVTHHSPSYKSVHTKYYLAGLANYCYVSDHDVFVDNLGKYGVTHWIHGHTHHPQEYMIGDVQVLSNPIGYPEENYSGVNIPECFINV